MRFKAQSLFQFHYKAKYINCASAITFDGKIVLLRNQTNFFKTGSQFASNVMVDYFVVFIAIKNL
jgi:hypothetical protein